MGTGLRPIKPRTGGFAPAVQDNAITKRTRSGVACDKCRERRGKVSDDAAEMTASMLMVALCDGNRPICRHCYRLGTTCVWATRDVSESRMQALRREREHLQRRNTALEALLTRLNALPESHAHATLSKYRSTPNADPEKFLDSIEGNLRLLQPSSQQAALSLLPRIQSGAELGFSIRYPTAYPVLKLLNHSIGAQTTLLATKLPDISPVKNSEILECRFPDLESEELNISFWTAVPVSDGFARGPS